jgi:hypothetical protein
MPLMVDGLGDALVGVAGPIAIQKLELHMIERIDTGEAVADCACQCGIAFQQRLLPADREQGLHGTFVPAAQAGKNRFSQFGIFDQFVVACSDPDIALREHHIHIREKRLKKGPFGGHCLQQ